MSNPEHQSTSEPRSSLEQTIEGLAKSVHDLLERVERVEASQRKTINHKGDNMLRQNNHIYFNKARSAGPFKVLKRMGQNAYVIDLPHDYGISSSFNIEDLVAYKSPIVSTKDGGIHRFLVRWQGRPDSECIWITRDELQRLDLDLLKYYQSASDFHSTGSSSSHPRRVGADTRHRPPIIHIYGRKNKKKTAQPVALWPISYWA
ncbi:hypothetical protein SO802_014299 [Lithocarpus litseifolius]|uniref:Chromo domain-containing protein n=1 Tax=Lithocarpus litseifolius TaxID=425828 RepID=A0AAW2CSU8_9ROSI